MADKPQGFGACTKCSCKGYNPSNVYGTCEAKRDDGSTVCGHTNSAHNAS